MTVNVTEAEFRAAYYNPDLNLKDVAEIIGYSQNRLIKLARRFGLPSRRELGIHARHKPIGNERWRPGNCATECPFWKACQNPPPGTVGLACEVFDWVEDNCDPARFEGDGRQYYRSPSLTEAMAVMGG